MKKISADYIFPVSSPPIQNGVLVVSDQGKILELAHRDSFNKNEIEIFKGVITPGFINSHCHLELSFLKDKISRNTGLVSFLTELISIRNHFDEDEISESIENADSEMMRNGIVAVGDISNGSSSFKTKAQSKIHYYNFIEAMGINGLFADLIYQKASQLLLELPKNSKGNITPHSPYSVSRELMNIIDKKCTGDEIISIHVQESMEENHLFHSKSGKFIQFYKNMNIDISEFEQSGLTSLRTVMTWLSSKNKILLVHNTYTTHNEIEWASSNYNNLYFCFCPKANLFIENKFPDFKNFLKLNNKLTIGTDSFASNDSLSILEEMKIILNHVEITFEEVLKWATINGAELFNIRNNFGTIESGKHPGLNLLYPFDFKKMTLMNDTRITPL